MDFCPICRSLGQNGVFLNIRMVKEAGEKGCLICQVILSGIETIEEMEQIRDFQAPPPKSHLVGKKHLEGCSFLVETKDDRSRRLYELEFYAEEGSKAARYFSHASTVLPCGNLDRIITMAKKWIKNCDENHMKCRNGLDPILPRRVLDVSRYEQTGKVYLIETGGMPGAYITLSHRWGNYQPTKTTSATLAHVAAGIPILSLPKTFLDAVQVTNAVYIRYLWIDSLCILQDSKHDWEEQSAQMAEIYSNSYLTLAASHAADSSVGLECQRRTFSGQDEWQEFQPVDSYEVPVSRYTFGEKIFVRHSQVQAHADIMSEGDTAKIRITHRHLDETSISLRAPLLSRAWAYQERLLSPRTLHCHSGELMWDCKTGVTCECGGLDGCNLAQFELPKSGLNGIGEMTLTDVLALWYKYVNEYSKLKLSYSNDCLPALSGPASWISRRISRLTSDGQYLAGLWRQDLVNGLLWHVRPPVGSESWSRNNITATSRRNPYQAPTWSWASHPGPIIYPQAYIQKLTPRADFEVVSTSCKGEGANIFGKVSHGLIICRGVLLSLPLSHSRDKGSLYFKIEEFGFPLSGTSSFRRAIFWPDVDFWSLGAEHHIKENETVYALLIASQQPVIHGLILKSSDAAGESYTRLGVFETTLQLFEILISHEAKLKESIKTIKIL